jgi:hypothetical protein
MSESQTTEPKYQIETHAGNPKIARVTNLNIKRLPECEGGGWYTDIQTACIIADAMNREDGRNAKAN